MKKYKNNPNGINILHWEHSEFQLEGIPSYPSHFIPITFRILYWMDTSDLGRFRKEKHFFPHDNSLPSGIEYSKVGTGNKGTVISREYWNGTLYYENISDIKTESPNYITWLENTSNNGQRLIDKGKQGKENLNYHGVDINEDFGPVEIVSTLRRVSASDLYLGFPVKIEYRIDLELFRIVEKTGWVLGHEKSQILYTHVKLIKWEILPKEMIPLNLFDSDHIMGVNW